MRLALILLALPALAQERDIPEAEWRKLVAGRAVHYQILGGGTYREFYALTGNEVWAEIDGICDPGTWTYEDGVYVFDWETTADASARHVETPTGLAAIAPEGNDSLALPHLIEKIDDTPNPCAPVPVG